LIMRKQVYGSINLKQLGTTSPSLCPAGGSIGTEANCEDTNIGDKNHVTKHINQHGCFTCRHSIRHQSKALKKVF
jgi:hypothetical protein